jgi:hypothetical protein
MEAALARVVSSSESAEATASEAASAIPATRPVPDRRRASRTIGLAVAAVSLAAVSTAVFSTRWRDRLLGGRGGSRPTQSAAGAPLDPSTVVRRVPLPKFKLVGAPSFDGTLFSIVDPDGNAAVVDLATGQQTRLTTDGVINEKDEQFAEFVSISADNKFVAYSWYALDGKYELRVIDMQGKRPRVLVRSDSLSYPVPIEWARDGQSILTTWSERIAPSRSRSYRRGTGRCARQGAGQRASDAREPVAERRVHRLRRAAAAVAYARDVFIIRSDGSNERRLIEHPANDANPVWADGQQVLFTSDRSGTMDVWGVSVDRGLPQGEPGSSTPTSAA